MNVKEVQITVKTPRLLDRLGVCVSMFLLSLTALLLGKFAIGVTKGNNYDIQVTEETDDA